MQSAIHNAAPERRVGGARPRIYRIHDSFFPICLQHRIMSLDSMVPGSELNPDWRAILAGAAVIGMLCLLPVFGGWVAIPGDASADQTVSGEEPGLSAAAIPFLIAAPGPFLAGYLARADNLEGAVEGLLSVPVGAAVPVVVAFVTEFLTLGSMGVAWKIEFLWRGVGFYAVVGLLFVPLACGLGAALGWVGRLVRDIVGGGVSIAWS